MGQSTLNIPSLTLSELQELQRFLTPPEIEELNKLLTEGMPIWVPLAGPQTVALTSEADVLFYGGAAGGGKTDLLIGLALTQHRRSIIFRREGTQLQGILDRLTEILRNRDGYNGQDRIWRLSKRQIEFGSCPNVGDEQRYQGRPHDLKGFDEITHFLEAQFRFLAGWLRTTDHRQRCRIICTGNPPTTSEGDWVIKYWAPWLDDDHPSPAKPGELRWYAMLDGAEVEVDSGEPISRHGKLIYPQSRTFIPSKVQDNPYLMATGYEAQLQALPEPLRSQMLSGDFKAGREDDPWQVIPSEWVRLAQERWTKEGKRGPMDSIGLDVARGGRDQTVIARRYGSWFDELLTYPGQETPDGSTVASLAVAHMRDAAPIHVDVIGVGTSVYDHLNGNRIQVIGINGAAGTKELDKTGKLRFVNTRALLWWRLREALDPKDGQQIALPPGNELRADLCAPRWKLMVSGIQIESKEDLIKRIGRSPDQGDAVVYGLVNTMKRDIQRDYRPRRRDSWMGA